MERRRLTEEAIGISYFLVMKKQWARWMPHFQTLELKLIRVKLSP